VVRQTFTLYRDLPWIDLQVDIRDWTGTHGRELRMFFPVGAPTAAISYDTPFGLVRVGVDELSGFAEMRPREAQSWINAEHETMSLTLSSSVIAYDWVDPLGYTQRPVLQAVLLATKRSCHPKGPWYTQKGHHTFTAAITGGARSIEERTRFGWEQRQPCETLLSAVDETGNPPHAPAVTGMLTIEPSNVVLTALKSSEGDDGFIVRCCEIAGRKTEARIRLRAGNIEAVRSCNLLEEEEELLSTDSRDGQMFAVTMEPFGITTLKLLIRT
jgi:alpha-mannosidase